MPSGFRLDTDTWQKDYEEARTLAQEVLQTIQERNTDNASGGAEASRKTATARRKIGTLGTTIERLLKWLDGAEAAQLSEAEKNRRRDLLYDLRNRREQMQLSLKRNPTQSDRDALMASTGRSAQGGPSQETEVTAELDTRGLLVYQQQTMARQDDMLGQMEKTVHTTKHIAVAIGEEVTLQTRLLDEMEEDMDVTQTRMKAATVKVKQLMKQTANWRGGLCIFILIITLVTLMVLFLKLSHLFLGH